MTNVTLIGCGKMGSALATRILKAGYPITVFNRTQEKCRSLVEIGAKLALSLQDAVKNADIILTSLFDDASVIEVCTQDGLIHYMKEGAIHVGTSTIMPKTSLFLQELHAKAGHFYIAANVLGVPKVALAGKLMVIAAGDLDKIKSCQFIFETFAEKSVTVGDNPAHANVIKISLNYILLTVLELVSELYVFSEKNGLNLDIIQGFLHGFFAHPAPKLYIDKIKQRDFDQVNFDLKGGIKDINLFQKSFAEAGVVPRLANIVNDRMIAGLAQGLEAKDWSAIYEVVRNESGLQ